MNKPREVELHDNVASRFNIQSEPGWVGPFTRDESPKARWKNGARVRKAKHETGDATPVGTPGTVLGSIYAPEVGVGYFVEWADRPHVAVFVVEWKIGP
jgi:hypothetical protein